MTGRKPTDHDWSPDRVTLLTRLWNERLTVTEIAAKMEISRNQVIGKAHRIHLPSRPNPIKRLRPETIAARLAEREAKATARAGRKRVRRKTTTPPPATSAAPMPHDAESRKAAYLAAGTNGKACSWPLGHPGEPDFHNCTDKAVIGKPYCASHCVEAFVPTPRARVQVKQHALYLDPSLLQGRYR